ncbi:MAG TPA: hypothetical protein VF331_01235, partial [Polyangiales bacterium]
ALRAELSGSALPAQLQRAPQTSRVDTHLSLVGAALHVGYDWHFGVLSAGPVIGASLLSLSGQAHGVGAQAQQGSDTSVALDAGAALTWHVVSWLGVRASARLGAPLSRRRFVVLGLGKVHEPQRITESLELSVFVQTK